MAIGTVALVKFETSNRGQLIKKRNYIVARQNHNHQAQEDNKQREKKEHIILIAARHFRSHWSLFNGLFQY